MQAVDPSPRRPPQHSSAQPQPSCPTHEQSQTHHSCSQLASKSRMQLLSRFAGWVASLRVCRTSQNVLQTLQFESSKRGVYTAGKRRLPMKERCKISGEKSKAWREKAWTSSRGSTCHIQTRFHTIHRLAVQAGSTQGAARLGSRKVDSG